MRPVRLEDRADRQATQAEGDRRNLVGGSAAFHKQRNLPLVRAEHGEGDNPAESQQYVRSCIPYHLAARVSYHFCGIWRGIWAVRRSLWQVEDAEGSGPGERLGAARDAELPVDVACMHLNGVWREVQPHSKFLVAEASSNQPEHLALALAQRLF